MIDPIKLECFRDVVSIVCDMRGYPIDKGIKDVLVGLWLHGLWTHMSCFGHEDQIDIKIVLHPRVDFPRDDWTMKRLNELTEGFDLVAVREGDQEKDGWISLHPAEYGNNLDYYRKLECEKLPYGYMLSGSELIKGETPERKDKQQALDKLKEWQAEFTRFANHLIATAE